MDKTIRLFILICYIVAVLVIAMPDLSLAQGGSKSNVAKDKISAKEKARNTKANNKYADSTDVDDANDFIFEHKSFMRLLYPSATNLKLSYQYQPTTEEEDGLGDSDKQQIAGEFDAILPLGSDVFMRCGLIYERNTYDMAQLLEDATDSDNEVLNHIGIRAGIGNFFGDDVLISGLVDVGLFSDLDSGLETENIRVHGEAITAYRINPGSQLIIGVRASDDIRTDSVYPMIGVRLISTDGQLHLGLTVPFDARIGYSVSTGTELYARAWVQGYDYGARIGRTDREVDIDIQDRRVGGGIIYWMGNSVSVVAEVGAMLEGKFELKIKDPDRFYSDLETAPYIRAAFGIVF